ncbi:DUF1295 domain-containing protein [Kangiella sediminilitoris]|uniref:Membrane protein n=1 Tax=Kangiella sediminilitoris TaxID=1144748 RepID=A0A1B3B864_9GAMM|nr:DUF1295 domain-containing protein [Kangiella sediminilitoris]AOE48970.1 membrane protein [Kangiella sediminilitoris]
MSGSELLWLMLGINIVAQLLAWMWQVKTRHADIADIVWSGMLAFNGIVFFILSDANAIHRYALLVIPVAWYLRLFFHLVSRYDLQHEDGRYQHLRSHWNENTQVKFLGFFIGQGLLISLFSIPAWALSYENAPFDTFDVIGIALVAISYLGVWLSDKQLAEFKKNKAESETVCRKGLWRYSRHPNYFFEWLHWFAYPLFALNSDWVWLLWIYPFLMLWFLIKLTGIPFNEQQNLRSKGEDYRQYQKETSMFFPMPVKNSDKE